MDEVKWTKSNGAPIPLDSKGRNCATRLRSRPTRTAARANRTERSGTEAQRDCRANLSDCTRQMAVLTLLQKNGNRSEDRRRQTEANRRWCQAESKRR